MSTQATLDAQASARKDRLAQLKSLKRKQPSSDDTAADKPTTSTSTPAIEDAHVEEDPTRRDVSHLLSGRNYDIVERVPKMGFAEAPSAGQETVEQTAARIAEETAAQRVAEEKEDRPIDLFNLQPKKPNWDLKRDVDKKLERLNARMDMAIARLIKSRIEETRKAKIKAGDTNGESPEKTVEPNLAKMVAEREKEDDGEEEGSDNE